MKEFKPLFTEENGADFEICQYWKHFWVFSDNQDFDERINIHKFLIEHSYKVLRISVTTSVTGIKSVDMENNEFEYRDETFVVAIFVFFLKLTISIQWWNSLVFSPNALLHENSFVWDVLERIRRVDAERKVFDYRVRKKLRALFGNTEPSRLWR